MVKHISEHDWYTNYEDDVLNHDKSVAIVFSAEWCGSCEKLLDRLEREEFPVEVLHIDVDRAPTLADELGVTSLPVVILYQDGDVAEELSNNTSVEDIIQAIKELD